MIAASPLSGCPLAKPATQHLRWSSEGKGTTIGATTGIVMCQWGVAMMYRTSGHKGPSPQRHKPIKECQRVVPSSSQPSRPFGAVRQGDTHDSGFAAIRGVPLPNQQRKFCDGPVRVKALRLGDSRGRHVSMGCRKICVAGLARGHP